MGQPIGMLSDLRVQARCDVLDEGEQDRQRSWPTEELSLLELTFPPSLLRPVLGHLWMGHARPGLL